MAGLLVCALVLCVTTTTALVAVQHLQLQGLRARVDYVAGRIPDIPSLLSNLHGDIEGVQELVSSGTTQTLLEAEMQGARVERVAEAFAMLVTVLQGYFERVEAQG
jgi:hypothetical protein